MWLVLPAHFCNEVGKADHRGKAATELRSLQGNMFRREGPEKTCQPNCGGKQMKRKSRQVTESRKCTILMCGDDDLTGSLIGESLCFVRKRVVSKSPVRKKTARRDP